jgi:predicted nucleotide-binding protein (sugar kinase/HSP70/actin superfamily)
MVNVGIPRALPYYQYFPMWKTFFEKPGAELVISPPTTKDMVASGASCVVSETSPADKGFSRPYYCPYWKKPLRPDHI